MSSPREATFISHSHDSQAHKDFVLRLASDLRRDGVDCELDQYVEAPKEGWARWAINEISQAKFVLVVCTPIYSERFRGGGSLGTGRGAKWEGAVITQEIYDADSNNEKFIPVAMSRSDLDSIPAVLRSTTHYVLDTPTGYE